MDTETKMRMQYGGAIGLLCEISPQVEDEDRESIQAAVEDWCELTGWSWKWILNRIEVFPPKTP